MATSDQIEAQIRIEREAISCGQIRLKELTNKLEDQSYASATVYGNYGISCLMPLVVSKIEEQRVKYRQGHNGQFFKEASSYLDDIEAEVLANITLKVLFDQMFRPPHHRIKDGSFDNLVVILKAIGAAVQAEAQMRFYEKEAPGLLKYLKDKYWHVSCGTRQKKTIVQLNMSKMDIQWKDWGQDVKIRLGGWLLNQVMSSCDWFETRIESKGKKKRTKLAVSKSFLETKKDLIDTALRYSAYCWPMLVEPNDWTKETRGGYLLNEISQLSQFVRRYAHEREPILYSQKALAFVNHLQKVPYRLNRFVLDVAKVLADQGRSVGKFKPIETLDLPPKPVDIAENYESRHAYRRAAAEVLNFNAASYRRAARTRAVLEVANRFSNEERFFIPWSLDYRGRSYPIPSFLQPQDTDFGKSLIRFADEATLTDEAEKWLSFQVGTSYGLDKEPIETRIAWVKENHDLISCVASDPLAFIHIWESTDEPWQFLASCDEYYRCCISKTSQTTGLPVAVDATCSGLQILAGLARDATAARMVNVTPGDKPMDAYKAVADAARPNVPEAIQPFLDRKVVKRVVMTIPYNAKPYSNRNYIREALKEKGVEITNEDLTQTVAAVRVAVMQVLPGPMAVMTWIEKSVTSLLADGAEYLKWTSPSGFQVVQSIDKSKSKVIALQLMGRVRVSIADGVEGPNINRHRNSTSPNLIHSIDAALLHLSLKDFEFPFTVIHDSIWGRATDMDLINQRIRAAYKEVFSMNVLQTWADEVGISSPPPIINDLDVSLVESSTYFFS